MHRRIPAVLLLALASASSVRAAEWQWSVPVPGQEGACTFLWIPPGCEKVNAVVLGQRNMLEEGILEHPAFRANLARLGIAEVWTVPPMDIVFRFDQGAGERLDVLLGDLAEKSGYGELTRAPLIPMGHSACASYPWNLAAWAPDRTLAVLSIKGDAPLTGMTGSGRPNPDWGNRNIDGIPGLMVMGEYEWLEGRLVPALEYRARHPGACIAMLPDIGLGHFDASDDLVAFLNLFIQKAADYRLTDRATPEGTPILRDLDPTDGWLVERWRLNQPRRLAPAPYADYAGDRADAFWAFDGETALAIHRYRVNRVGRTPQLIGFLYRGQIIRQSNTHFQVRLPTGLLEEDGMTFRVETVFLDRVEEGSDNLPRWTSLPVGTPLTHAAEGGPILVDRISGPVVKIAQDTFRVALDRTWATRDRRNRDIWLLARHPGDLRHKSMVQQALMAFPENKEGKEQTIVFPAIADVTHGVVSIPLEATSSAGLPVRFFVKDGPAEITGRRLYFTRIPPRAGYPVSVTVVAYQLGTSREPKTQAAPMVERTFHILDRDIGN